MLDTESSLYFNYVTYPFRRPPEMDGVSVRHPVAIVGGGPVGLAIGLSLALYGVRSVIIEADSTVCGGSRAACISRRSQEILQKIGAIEGFMENALPWTKGQSFYRGEVIYDLEMPDSADEAYRPMANLTQNYIEQALVDRAAQVDLVDLRWQSKVTALRHGADGAVLTVETPEGSYDLAADWVVACDGARSTIRQLMGLRLSGTSYEGKYLIADIKMRGTLPMGRKAWFDPACNRGSTILMHKMVEDVWRVDYQLRDDDDEEEQLRPEVIRGRITEVLAMAGETAPWELDWYSLYKAHCLCLDRYDHGRVIFAGDAAHLVPIFGVRGLNSGFADADNLAWKLAAVVNGQAGEALLGTYTPERREATQEIFREAGKSTRFMTPPSSGYKLMRDAALRLSLSQDFAGLLANPRQSAPYDYVDSPLNDWAEAEPDFAAGPKTGAPLRSVALAPGAAGNAGFLTDLFGHEAIALYFIGDPGRADLLPVLAQHGAGTRPFRAIVIHRGDAPAGWTGPAVADREGRIFATYGAGHGTVYLARPDWHVAARHAAPDPAELEGAIARLWGDAP